MSERTNHQAIVKTLLETKAVDFNAVGKAVAQLGPALSLADEPWEGFCGTMRTFFHCYVLNGGINPVNTVDNLKALSAAAAELKA
jgi:hypothetical protein